MVRPSGRLPADIRFGLTPLPKCSATPRTSHVRSRYLNILEKQKGENDISSVGAAYPDWSLTHFAQGRLLELNKEFKEAQLSYSKALEMSQTAYQKRNQSQMRSEVYQIEHVPIQKIKTALSECERIIK